MHGLVFETSKISHLVLPSLLSQMDKSVAVPIFQFVPHYSLMCLMLLPILAKLSFWFYMVKS